jgi:L-glyceraldehyde 3-phosphate reductase
LISSLDRSLQRLQLEFVNRLTRLNQVARERGQSLARLALNWVLRDPRITSVVLGASRIEQLRDNLKIVDDAQLTAAEMERIEAILSS